MFSTRWFFIRKTFFFRSKKETFFSCEISKNPLNNNILKQGNIFSSATYENEKINEKYEKI